MAPGSSSIDADRVSGSGWGLEHRRHPDGSASGDHRSNAASDQDTDRSRQSAVGRSCAQGWKTRRDSSVTRGRALVLEQPHSNNTRVPLIFWLLSAVRKFGTSRSISSKYDDSAGVFCCEL